MAKSARATVTKNNNQRLKKNVFGPIESARTERLSAKLLELAAQPKPPRDAAMEDVTKDPTEKASKEQPARDESMDIDSAPKGLSQKQQARRKIEKRKAKKSSIVFPKYGERRSSRKKR